VDEEGAFVRGCRQFTVLGGRRKFLSVLCVACCGSQREMCRGLVVLSQGETTWSARSAAIRTSSQTCNARLILTGPSRKGARARQSAGDCRQERCNCKHLLFACSSPTLRLHAAVANAVVHAASCCYTSPPDPQSKLMQVRGARYS
jgi:hypothetical protein